MTPGAGALLEAVIETSDDAILLADMAGRVATWSGTCERVFGQPAGEALGRPVEGLFPEHLRRDVVAALARSRTGERVRRLDTEVLRPDGLAMPVSLSLCPVEGADGRPAGAVLVARDVTEQVVAQATLAEVERRLEEGEALARVGSWLWDVRTGVVQWSPELHRIHGVDPRDFEGTFESHLAPVLAEDLLRVRAGMQAAVTTGRRWADAYRILRPDGAVRLLRVRAEPTWGSAGTVVALRGVGQDAAGEAGY
ncbi:MAG: PAS domain-containing protein [Acidimicrobiales bacterium]